jgi:hypothetical protein
VDDYEKMHLLKKIYETQELLEEILELVDNIDTEDND